jgi:hypothetical protein
LPTEEITRLLSESQEIYKKSDELIREESSSDLDSLRISSSKINLQEGSQESLNEAGRGQQAQILQPPKGGNH